MEEFRFKAMLIMEAESDILHYAKKLKKLSIQRHKEDELKIDILNSNELIDITITLNEISQLNSILFDSDDMYDCGIKIKILKLNSCTKYVFVLINSANIIKNVIVKNIFKHLHLSRINLDNDFFHNLIEEKNHFDLKEQSIMIGYSNKEQMMMSNINPDKYNRGKITEIKLDVRLIRKVRIKVSNKGLIKFFNKPTYDEIFQIIEILDDQLINMDFEGDSNHE